MRKLLEWVNGPRGFIPGLAICSGLIVDFGDAQTKLSKMLPEMLQALLPILSIGGATFFFVAGIRSTGRWVYGITGRGKFRSLFPEIDHHRAQLVQYLETRRQVEDFHGRVILRGGFTDTVVTGLKGLALRLEALSIPTPPSPHSGNIREWLQFLIELSYLSESGRLKEAQKKDQSRPPASDR